MKILFSILFILGSTSLFAQSGEWVEKSYEGVKKNEIPKFINLSDYKMLLIHFEQHDMLWSVVKLK